MRRRIYSNERPVDRIRFLDVNPPVCAISFSEASGTYARVQVPIGTPNDELLMPQCEVCSEPCIHQVMAIEELLTWLRQPNHPRRDELIKVCETVPWAFWLDTLSTTVHQLDETTNQLDRKEIWWSINLRQLSIDPYIFYPGTTQKAQETSSRYRRCGSCAFPTRPRHTCCPTTSRSQQRAAKREDRLEEFSLMRFDRLSIILASALDHQVAYHGKLSSSP